MGGTPEIVNAPIRAGALRKTRTNLRKVRLRALRGAITCDENSKPEIEAKTRRLMKELLSRNEL